MERYVPEPRKKKKLTAAMMALVFGTFGAHKFYLGNSGAGIFFMMLFVMSVNIFGFPISALLGFIDAMKILGMSNEEFDHKYNTKSIRTGQSYGRQKRRHTKENPDFRRKTTSKRTQPVKRKSNKSGFLRKENAYVKTGIQKYKEFDLAEAIVDFEKGLEIEPNNVALHFNIACAYSLLEEKQKAFSHISKAVANGLKDVSKIDTHEDLAFIRIQKEYADFKESGYRTANIKSTTTTRKKTATTSNPSVNDDLLGRLNKLAELRKRGLLSEKEFLLEKEKLMG